LFSQIKLNIKLLFNALGKHKKIKPKEAIWQFKKTEVKSLMGKYIIEH